MSRRGSDTLQLLNSAVALVLLIPILLLVVSAVHERARVPSADRGRPHDQPPIIVLSESQGYSFPSGRADLSPAFQTRLRTDIIPKLKRTIADYQCDVVEVVGHTDSQPVASRSITDADLLAFVGGQNMSVSPGSIADGSRIQYYGDGKLLFDFHDPAPYTRGHFAFRTTQNHMEIRHFRVYRLNKENDGDR